MVVGYFLGIMKPSLDLHRLVSQNQVDELQNELNCTNGLDLWIVNKDGLTVFDLANPTISKQLTNYIQSQLIYYTPLCFQSILNNQIQQVIDYTKHPISKYINWNYIDPHSGQSMLHQSILNNNKQTTKLLLSLTDPHIRNAQGSTIFECNASPDLQTLINQHTITHHKLTTIKSGWLFKGKGLKSKKRWFQLNNDAILSCYKNEDCKNCRGILSIEEATIVVKSSTEFHLCTPYFRWKLTCLNETEQQEWMTSLKQQNITNATSNSSLFTESTSNASLEIIKQELTTLQQGLTTRGANELNHQILNIKQQLHQLQLPNGNAPLLMPILQQDEDDTVSESEDDEFFDATDTTTAMLDDHGIVKESLALPGYPSTPRQTLPCDFTVLKTNASPFALLKDLIGQDLLHVVLPVAFCEPASILFRCCEMMEYSNLLDLALLKSDNKERLLLVTAFAMSSYASGIDRTNKPFDPFVSETFELGTANYRGLCEQQTPNTSACYFESNNNRKWTFHFTGCVVTKFHGAHISVQPQGHALVTLKLTNTVEEVYSWQPVKASCNGILTGGRWLDHHGVLTVKCHSTPGLQCDLEFIASDWRRKHQYKLQGNIDNTWQLNGMWNDHLTCKRIDGEKNTFHLREDVLEPPKHGNETERSTVLWHCKSERMVDCFHFTKNAISMNESTEELRGYLPPTDTRLRPDLRAMENGDYANADILLKELEKKHRHNKQKPLWFNLEKHQIANIDYYAFNDAYWKCREKKEFKDSVNLFDL